MKNDFFGEGGGERVFFFKKLSVVHISGISFFQKREKKKQTSANFFKLSESLQGCSRATSQGLPAVPVVNNQNSVAGIKIP